MIIFSPGPGNISDRVRNALRADDIGHRSQEFRDLIQDVRKRILTVLQIEQGYKSIILNGSGTSAIESTISSLKGSLKGVLFISNGVYGERAAQMAEIYGINYKELKFEWGELPPLDLLQTEFKNPAFDAVYLVHHETTTGLLNPLKEIAQLAKKNDKFVLVDTVSSVCGEELNIAEWGVDVALGTPTKCIRGVPGIAFVVASERFLDKIQQREKVTFCNDLLTHLNIEDNKSETPFTPAVQVYYAFREALTELQEEGLANRLAHYAKIAAMLRKGLKDASLKLLLDEKLYANTMTSVILPHNLSFTDLQNRLKSKGYLIYDAQGKFKDKVFRLGTVGIITETDIKNFLTELNSLL